MNIGRALFERFTQNLVHKFDDRRFRIVQIKYIRLLFKLGIDLFFCPALQDCFKSFGSDSNIPGAKPGESAYAWTLYIEPSLAAKRRVFVALANRTDHKDRARWYYRPGESGTT